MNMRHLIVAWVILAATSLVMNLAAVPARSSAGPSDGKGGFWLGRMNLSPTLDLGIFYDSNPDEVNESRKRAMEAAEDVEGDRFDSAVGYNIQPGIILNMPGNRWSVSGRAYYIYEKDDSDYTRSPKDWMETLSIQGKTDGGFDWRLDETVQQLKYAEYDEFSQEDRFAVRFGGALAKQLTDKSKLGIGAAYSTVEYDDEDAYDNEYLDFSMNFSHQLTEKTEALAVAGYGINSSEEEDSDAHEYNLSAGLGSRATEKLSYRALIGVTLYEDFEYENAEGVKEDAETEYSLSYDLGVSWRPTERISVNLTGGTSYEAAEDVRSNALLASTLVGSVDYRLFRRWLLSGGVAYRHEDYMRNVDRGGEDVFTGVDSGGESRTDQQINTYASLVFGVNRYASLFAHGLYSVTDSTIEDFEFDRYRISAGVALQY